MPGPHQINNKNMIEGILYKVGEKERVGAATGFFITEDGYIATSRHVVDDEQVHYNVILSDSSQLPAMVVYEDPAIDFALLKIEGAGYTSAELGDSDALKLGQSVFAVGNVLGQYNNSISMGIISGLNRNIRVSGQAGTENIVGVIQTDVAINFGNSGGPLVNIHGEVVGINIATVTGSNNIGFSIPINIVKGIIQTASGAYVSPR